MKKFFDNSMSVIALVAMIICAGCAIVSIGSQLFIVWIVMLILSAILYKVSKTK